MDNTTFNAAALTEAQYDGLACVVCGRDYLADPVPHRPVGVVDGGQVFACTTCVLAAELRQAAAALRDEAARLDEHAARMREHADRCDEHATTMDGTR